MAEEGGEDQGGAAGGSSGEAGSAAPGGGEPSLGQPCSPAGALGCNGAAQKQRLICESGTWHMNGSCSAEQNCDQTSGVCATIVPECATQTGGALVCGTGDVVERCGVDRVSAAKIQTCAGKCVPQAASAACAPTSCGDGKVQSGEECDDGNTVDTDACTNACKKAVCGDGATWTGHEACDDGNTVNTDACVACKLATCGDTFVQAGKEQCDTADPATVNHCARSCNFSSWPLWPMPNPPSTGLPHPASYDLSTDGIVTDKVTGLIWQRTVDTNGFFLADAKAYCANLTLAGFTDWRLPTRIELVSLADFTLGSNPGTSFPSDGGAWFWTSSLYLANSSLDHQWIVGRDGETGSGAVTGDSYSVRCVR